MERRTLHSALQLVACLYANGYNKQSILKLKGRIDRAFAHSEAFETTQLKGKEFPILYAQKSKDKKYWRTLPCFFCGSQHTHSALPGHRIPHCEEPAFDEITLNGHVFKQSDGYFIKLLELRHPIVPADVDAYRKLKDIKMRTDKWGPEAGLEAMKLMKLLLNHADERMIPISEQNYINGYVFNTLNLVRSSKIKDYQSQAYKNRFSKVINLVIRQFRKYYEHLV